MLILGLGDGLFELHLGIGCLLVAQIELGQEVVPALTEIAEHDSDRRSETPRSDGDSAPERSSRRAQHHVRLPDTGAEAGDDIDNPPTPTVRTTAIRTEVIRSAGSSPP